MTEMIHRILFRLTETHLLVANTGHPFGKAGFKAICYPATSSKGAGPTMTQLDSSMPMEWVEEVRKKRVETFKREPEALHSASNMALLTAGDYSGRVLLELLQNAVDAGRKEQIGYKGIGFRSVLNDSESIEIHSGNLHARWSHEDAKAALADLNDLPQRLPMLDLPAWVEPDEEVKTLLQHPYDTIVRLKMHPVGMKHLLQKWSAISSDPSLVLFIDGNLEIKWEQTGVEGAIWHRQDKNKIVSVNLNTGNSTQTELRWRRFEYGKASAAYRIRNDGKFQPAEVTSPRLRCYFPAAQSPHPFPNLFLHHSGFELQSNREAVEPSSERLHELAEVIARAAQSIEDPSDLMDLLQVGNFDKSDSAKIETQVWNTAHSVLITSKFPALNGRSLNEIKICPQNEELPYQWRDKSRQSNWKAFLLALQRVRSNGLTGLPVLPPGVENENRERTLRSFNPNCPFKKYELQKEHWVPVESSDQSVSSSSFKVFLPHQGPALNPPLGIEVRFLDEALLKEFGRAGGKDIESFLTQTLAVREFSALAVIEHAVLLSSILSEPLSHNHPVIEFLKRLRDADKVELNKPIDVFDWKDAVRRELIQKLKLTCQDRDWYVIKVYASENWTGDNFLERTYGDKRGYLEMPPPTDENKREGWESFWKWLGVGWCPKVLPVIAEVVSKCRDKRGLLWNGQKFAGAFFADRSEPPCWNKYCEDISREDSFPEDKRKPRLKSNWTIDGGDVALTTEGAFVAIGVNWGAYRGWLESEVCFSTNKATDYDDSYMRGVSSHLCWLFRSASWIPCKDDRLHAGQDVFDPAGEVAHELPSFIAQLQLPEVLQETSKIPNTKEFLINCGIRKDWRDVQYRDWIAWLKRAAERRQAADGDRPARDAIRSLYAAILQHRSLKEGSTLSERDTKPLEGFSLWGVERKDELHEVWRLHKAGEDMPLYVDRADVADVFLPGLYVFPVRLNACAARAERHLKLCSLSNVLRGTPIRLGELRCEYSDVVQERLNELAAYLRVGRSVSNDVELKKYLSCVTLQSVSGLMVQFSLHDKLIGGAVKREKLHYFDSRTKCWAVFVDSACLDDEQWLAFAETLLLSCNQPSDKALNIKELLRCDSAQLPKRLTSFGVDPETAEQLRQKRVQVDLYHASVPEINVSTDSVLIPNGLLSASNPVGEPARLLHTDVSHPSPDQSDSLGRVRTAVTARGRHSSDVDGQRRPSSRPHPEEGIKAQQWLFDQVSRWCNENFLPPPEWEKNLMDITILTSPPIIIEAKRIDGSTIHLSRNQIEQAGRPEATFVVALLRPSIGSDYDVFWVLRPLEELGNLHPRIIEWTWQLQKGSPFTRQSWAAPEPPPSKAANSFQAEVALPDDWILKLPKGVAAGLDLTRKTTGQ